APRMFDLEDDAPAPLRIAEVEPEPLRAACEEVVLGPDARAFVLEARDLRQLRLRLLGLRLLVAEARNEPLQAIDVDGDALVRLGCMLGPLRLLATPRVPGTGEVRRLARLELEGRVRHRFEEPAVVGD